MSLWAIVPAAGVGSRFGAAMPKQYLPCAGQRIIEHTLQALLACEAIHTIVVAIADADPYWEQLPLAGHPRIRRVSGGLERADSVLAGLRAIAASDEDWVLVHDAARPCLRRDVLENMLSSLEHDPVGGILASPVADTVKREQADHLIAETVDRRGLWLAQTPQLFRFGLLRDALTQALDHGWVITDEASAVEAAGYAPRLFAGPADNIKITRPEDLALAELILEARQHA